MSLECNHCGEEYDLIDFTKKQGYNKDNWICPRCGGLWK